MNHRERVFAVMARGVPDRVPRLASLTPAVREAFRKLTGSDDPATYWDWDFAGVGFRRPNPLPDLHDRFGRFFQDRGHEWLLDWERPDFPPEWGVATRPAHMFHLSAPVPPMIHFTEASDLADYPFPDYVGEWQHDHLEGDIQHYKDQGYPVSAFIGWIFQTGWSLRSEVRLFEDFYDNPVFASALLDRITEIRIAQAVRLVEAGVDAISMNDDIGAQKSMIISPKMWRRWLKPRMGALIDAIRAVNPDVHFRYHSDGYYVPVIPDLIEMGVTSLRTVQVECMDIYEIKRQYGQDICLEGTIGLQSELKDGTPDEVRAMVKAQCEGMMPGGGWVASPGNGITPDIPIENLAAMFEALDEYSWYDH